MRVLMKFPVHFLFLFSFVYFTRSFRASENKMPDTILAPNEPKAEKYRKKRVKSAEIENKLDGGGGSRGWIAVKIVEKIPCVIRRRFRIIQSLQTHVPHTHTQRASERATWKCTPKIKRKYFMQTEVIIFPQKYSSLQFSISLFFFLFIRSFALRLPVLHFVSFWADLAFCFMLFFFFVDVLLFLLFLPGFRLRRKRMNEWEKIDTRRLPNRIRLSNIKSST